MKKFLLVLTASGILAGCAPTYMNSEGPPPKLDPTPGSVETIVILSSDSPLGAGLGEADRAARVYCSGLGKLPQFVSRLRPQELREDILPEYAMVTYRCYTPKLGAP